MVILIRLRTVLGHLMRVAVFVSAAIVEASDKIVEKGKRIAAHLLEAAQDDIEFAKGAFIVAGRIDQSAFTMSLKRLLRG